MRRVVPYLSAVVWSCLMLQGVGETASDPITGPRLDSLIAAQNLPLQSYLEKRFPEAGGYVIAGPLDPLYIGTPLRSELYHSVRIICPDPAAVEAALAAVKQDSTLGVDSSMAYIHQARADDPVGYRGALIKGTWRGEPVTIQLATLQQIRWLIWARRILEGDDPLIPRGKFDLYARAVSEHLYATDRRWNNLPTPKAVDYGLRDSADIYPPLRHPVFEVELDFRRFLNLRSGLYTSFAQGIRAFVPTDSLLEMLRDSAPAVAYPNKMAVMLQQEYLEFFARDGNIATIKTLTRPGFDSLPSGVYLFAVGLSGNIRFCKKPTPEEMRLIEVKTGKKAPLVTEAFFFPGEPVLAAGSFAVQHDSMTRMAAVNAFSDHFFYCNLSPSLRDDVAIRSNQYVLSLGRFFRALDDLNIPYGSLLISKF